MRALYFLLLIFSFSGCEILSSGSGQFEARIVSSNLVLDNKRDETVYYFPVGASVAARIYWLPVSTGQNAVREGFSTSIPLDQISQDEDERELLVHWWTTTNPATIRIISIPL